MIDFNDLADLPSYVNPKRGIYTCMLSGTYDEEKKFVKFTFVHTEEPPVTEEKDADAIGDSPDAGDLTTISGGLDNEYGQGIVKSVLMPLVEADIIAPGPVDQMVEALSDVKVQAVLMTTARKDKETKEIKYYPKLEGLVVV